MSIKVDSNYTAFFTISKKPDHEWQQIIEKLWNVYGIRSSGSKELDKQILHEHELKDAEKETTVTSKFLTVTKAEQEKIIAKKKNKKAEVDKKPKQNDRGAEILGQQIFLAIKMKDNDDKLENKKKRSNNYQT